VLRRAAIGAAAATLVNLVTYAVAVIDGVSFRLRGQADVFQTFQAFTSGFRWVRPYNVAIDTALPFLLGALVFWLATRRSRSAAIGVLILAAGVALIVPAALPDVARMTTPALVILSLMALIAGAIFVGALAPASPTARAASARTPQGHPDRSPRV
jgi:peptidoglycan/LPS O-acetylase OafA/YrhL